jgi:hypothetical protein
MQRDRIADAVAGLSSCPLIARELILAEPLIALSHAAADDVVVIGGDTTDRLRRGSLATALARRFARRGHPAALVVVTARPTRFALTLTTAA